MAEIFEEPTWAVLELFGKKVMVGEVSSVTKFGTEMCRIDVPEVGDIPAYTKFFGGTAIYAVTPLDEASALRAVKGLRARPINPWMIPIPRIPAETHADIVPPQVEEGWEYDEEDEEYT